MIMRMQLLIFVLFVLFYSSCLVRANEEKIMTTEMGRDREGQQSSTTLSVKDETHANEQRRRDQSTTTCLGDKDATTMTTAATMDAPTVLFEIDESNMTNYMEASKLTMLLNEEGVSSLETRIENHQNEYELLEGWSDWWDMTILGKKDGICYAVFGGETIFAHIQNINPFSKRIPETDCVVRRGYYNAYLKSNTYGEEFQTALKNCIQSCTSVNREYCPLILSGYSRGGAIAIVAGIMLRQYNPTIVTFGATKSIIPTTSFWSPDETLDCTDFPANNHYRFVNMLEGGYDGVAIGGSTANPAVHYGHTLFLDENTETYVGSPGLDGATRIRQPDNSQAHDLTMYMERIDKLYNHPCNKPTIPVGKWPFGHSCHYNDECSNYCEQMIEICM